MLWPLHESCGHARALRAAASAYALQATRHQYPTTRFHPATQPSPFVVLVRWQKELTSRCPQACVLLASSNKRAQSTRQPNPARCIGVLDFFDGSRDQETPRRPFHEASIALAAGRPWVRGQRLKSKRALPIERRPGASVQATAAARRSRALLRDDDGLLGLVAARSRGAALPGQPHLSPSIASRHNRAGGRAPPNSNHGRRLVDAHHAPGRGGLQDRAAEGTC